MIQMQRIITFFSIGVILLALASCSQESAQTQASGSDEHHAAHEHTHALDATTFDRALAEKYGADQYGMKQYVMAFLKRGPNRKRSEEESNALQQAHMENIGRLAEEGKLILAGPFLDDGELRGIYIFNVTTVEEARSLTETDPAIQAGSLVMDLVPWYGSAALMEVNSIHDRITEVSF